MVSDSRSLSLDIGCCAKSVGKLQSEVTEVCKSGPTRTGRLVFMHISGTNHPGLCYIEHIAPLDILAEGAAQKEKVRAPQKRDLH